MRVSFIVIVVLLVRLASGSGLAWVERYNGPVDGDDRAAALDYWHGKVYVTGHSQGPGQSTAATTIVYDSAGNRLWDARYQPEAGSNAEAHAVAVSGSGRVYVAGSASVNYVDRFTVVAYDSLLRRPQVYDYTSGDASANAVAVRGDTAYATGFRYHSGTTEEDYFTCKLGPDSSQKWWGQYYGFTPTNPDDVDDEASAVAVDGGGNVYVTGASQFQDPDSDAGHLDYATVKYTAAGDTVWTRRYDAGYYRDDEATALALDSGGNVIVTGSSIGADGSPDFYTIKYTSSGALVWGRRWSYAQSTQDEAVAVACDAAGNVYVTGTSNTSGSDLDIVTVKYNAAGDSVWTAIYDTAGGTECAQAIQVDDAAGCVYVGGSASLSPFNSDFAFVKLSAQNGSVLRSWVAPDSETGGSNTAYGMYVDRDAAIYLSGYGFGDTSSEDMVILKYRQTFAFDVKVCSIGVPTWCDVGDTFQPTVRIGYTSEESLHTFTVRLTIGTQYVDSTSITLGAVPETSFVVPFQTCAAQPPGQMAVRCTVCASDPVPTNNWDTTSIRVDGSGWVQRSPMPTGVKAIADGGWLAHDAGTVLIYASRGNRQRDFFSYDPAKDSWKPLERWPLGTEYKPPSKGSAGCTDGNGVIYATKGNNKLGFYRYDASKDSWYQKKDVPLGPNKRKAKGGTGIVWAYKGAVGSPYLLKGYKNEFYKYNVVGDSWTTLTPAPIGANQKWDKGSWLAYDDVNNKIYAFKAKYMEFYRYSPDGDSWSGQLVSMPTAGSAGNKKSKDGGCGTYVDSCIYALKGGNTQEFWKCAFTTTGNSWAERETLPKGSLKKRVKAGGSVTSTGRKLYAFKGNKCNELWRYVPSQTGLEEDVTRRAPRGGGGRDNGETPILDGLSASLPRWDPMSYSSMVVYSKEDTVSGYEQVYQRLYGSTIPEQRVTEVATDCEEPVVSPLRPGGQLIAFQMADTLSDCYEICVTPAYAAGGGGGSGGTDEVPEEPVVSSDAAAPASSVAPVGSVSALAATGASTILSRPILQRTFGDEADRLHPEFDQIGTWICYERDVDGPGGCYTQIWRVPADSGPEEQVTFDNADHFSPSFLNPMEILFTLSPNTGYDVVAKANLLTHQVTVLSNLQTDHDRPNAAWNGAYAVSEALDDAGNAQIVKIPALLGAESWLTSGTSDIMEPDYSPDNQSVFAVRWTGITSQIVCVNAQNGGYLPVTDSLAIRDNPDVHLSPNGPTSLAVYEREAWNPLDLLLGGGKRKPGSGIYLSKFRRPHDGEMGAGLGVFALDRIEPNPASSKMTVFWQIPALCRVNLKVYNTAGQLVKVLAQGEVKPGRYATTWAGTDQKGRRLAAGIYFCTLDTGDKRLSRKVVLTGH